MPIASYTNGELIEKKDELSLIMLINKLRNSGDFKTLKEIPAEYFEELSEKDAAVSAGADRENHSSLSYRLNVPRREVEQFTDQIKGGEFQMLFDSFEAYDVQETRRISKAEGKAEGKAEDILELLSELGTAPEELCRTIQETTDLEKLKSWLKLAAKAENIGQFREKAGNLNRKLRRKIRGNIRQENW